MKTIIQHINEKLKISNANKIDIDAINFDTPSDVDCNKLEEFLRQNYLWEIPLSNEWKFKKRWSIEIIDGKMNLVLYSNNYKHGVLEFIYKDYFIAADLTVNHNDDVLLYRDEETLYDELLIPIGNLFGLKHNNKGEFERE